MFDGPADLKCPSCGRQQGSKVVDSRGSVHGQRIRRRRECLICQTRFTTHEAVISAEAVRVRDGLQGIRTAAEEILARVKTLIGNGGIPP